MPPIRYRQVHNLWGVYSGPDNPTGYCFADYNGERHNNPSLGQFDSNLLRQIDRVQNFQFGFDIERQNLAQLGTRGLVNNYIVNRPSIQVNFNYYLIGVRNEKNLGFAVNYPSITNTPVLSEQTCFLKNFTGWNTDPRNIFVAVSPDNNDLHDRIYDNFHSTGLINEISPKDLFVFGFGNCYLNSYRVGATVGQLPQASVGFICSNIMGYASGSGMNIPAVHPKTGELISGVKFTIPHAESIKEPSVIRPSDITLEITNLFEPEEQLFNYIYLYNIQTLEYNKIEATGYKGNENLLIHSGISSPSDNYFSGIYVKNLSSNLYNRLFVSGATNNEVLVVNQETGNVAGDNVFDTLYIKNVTGADYYALNTSGAISNENLSIAYIVLRQYPKDALFGVSSFNTPIQSFDFTVNLDREDLRSIGYVLPVDRRLNFPVFADINFSTIVGENKESDLTYLLKTDKTYDIIINMYNPSCETREIAIQYKIQNSKFKTTNYSYGIGANLVANFGFLAEIDVDNLRKGFYISGLLNAPEPEFPYNFLLLESNKTGFLYTEDNNLLIVSENV